MKRILNLIIVFSMCLLLLIPIQVQAKEVDMEMTFGEIENIILDYLNKENMTYDLEDEEITDFFYKVLADGDVPKDHPNFAEINAYAAEYFYRQDLQSESNVNPMAEIRNFTLQDIKNQIIEEEKLKNSNLNIDMIQLASSYNASKAVSYAQRWANSYNSTYNKYPTDCTNFVSQAIYEGGMPFGSTGATSNIEWYSKIISGKRVDSRAWTVAHDFSNYWAGKGKVERFILQELQ